MVGYNRRFSPLACQAREVFQRVSGPLLINYRVNAGFLPKEHWTQTEQGGGRILGEVCHFVDLMQFLTGSEPVGVYALSVAADNAQMPDQDNIVISLRFQNGSVGQICYLACGDKLLSKERIEIFGGGQSFIIDDFRLGEHYVGGSRRRLKLARQRTPAGSRSVPGRRPRGAALPDSPGLARPDQRGDFCHSRLVAYRAAAASFAQLFEAGFTCA